MNVSKVGVVAGLDPAIHRSKEIVFRYAMDARVKPAHDGVLGLWIPGSRVLSKLTKPSISFGTTRPGMTACIAPAMPKPAHDGGACCTITPSTRGA